MNKMEHSELIRLADLRDQIRDELASITDKHHDGNLFYRVNCASEILAFYNANRDRLDDLFLVEKPLNGSDL